MNNLPQTKIDAKQAYLARQRADMISRYKQSDRAERNAIIRQIDALLPVLSGDEKAFWLKFRRELERLNEQPTGIKADQCIMRCGEASDYDGKYCRTCVERIMEDREVDNDGDEDFSDLPICGGTPF